MDFAPGTKLSRFRLDKKIGRGAAGVVYLATDTLLHQPVALKVIHDHLVENAEVRERFKREIVLTRRVSHPGVCRLHDVHEDQGVTFITMELVDGETLSALIQREGKLTPQRTLELFRGLASPLDAAHAAGVVHRDLKPGNIMVRADGSVMVLDFGMATADDVSKITHVGRTVGSLRFIAPEVWEGQPATAVSDLYALGVIIYACLAGRLPYDAVTPAEAFQAQRKAPPPLSNLNSAVGDALNGVVRKMMSRAPADRFATAGAALAAFEKALKHDEGGRTVALSPVSLDDATSDDEAIPPGPRAVPRAAWIGGGAAALLALAVGIVVVATDGGAPADAGRSADATARGSTRHLVVGSDGTDDPPRAGRDPVDADPVDPADADPDPDPDPGTDPGTDPVADPAPGKEATTTGASRAQVAAVMKKRGFLPGDVPLVDGIVARARMLEARGKPGEAAALYDKAKNATAREAIDRGFITSKQKRLHFASERAAPPTQAKIALLEREVEKLAVARDYVGANERLNRAFAMLK